MDELNFSGTWERHLWFKSFTLKYDVTNDRLFLFTCNKKTIKFIKGGHIVKKCPLFCLITVSTKAEPDLHVKYESINSWWVERLQILFFKQVRIIEKTISLQGPFSGCTGAHHIKIIERWQFYQQMATVRLFCQLLFPRSKMNPNFKINMKEKFLKCSEIEHLNIYISLTTGKTVPANKDHVTWSKAPEQLLRDVRQGILFYIEISFYFHDSHDWLPMSYLLPQIQKI